MTLSYAQQLKHPNWQKKRLEMLNAAGWKCQHCDAEDVTLHVHHKQYIKGRKAWEYDQDELAVLCEDCHQDEHHLADELKTLLGHVNTADALALLRGFYFHADWFDLWIGDEGRDRSPDIWRLGIAAFLLSELPPVHLQSVLDYAMTLFPEPTFETYLHYQDIRDEFAIEYSER